MNKEERIEDIMNIMAEVISKDEMHGDMMKYGIYYVPFTSCAEALCDKGYHKTMWHKVADGDLPEYAGSYFVVCGDESLPEYDVDFYENHKDGKRWIHNEGRVIAWTELLPYQGN